MATPPSPAPAPHPTSEQGLGELLALLRNACHLGGKTGFAPAIQFVGVDEASLTHPGIRWNLQETAACLDDCGFVLCVHLAADTAPHADEWAKHRAEHLHALKRHGIRVMLNCRWLPGGEAPTELSEDTCDFVRFDFSARHGHKYRRARSTHRHSMQTRLHGCAIWHPAIWSSWSLPASARKHS